ncbi:beta-glucosidase BglX [soil metagenome]
MKKAIGALQLLFLFLLLNNTAFAQKKSIDQRVDSVLKLMTLDEKVGQMNQYNGDWEATGPVTNDGYKQAQIRGGMVGSMLNVTGVAKTRSLQQMAMQSRLKIPLLFGQDIIHGFKTTFPIPLGEAASWNLELIEKSARIAGIEAASAGVHWTFAPMVDIARDPRWGRVMEGAGEDTYLGSLIATARVKGFQGKGLGNTDALMACAKHFAAYGAAIGGRDYNAVDMSLQTLYEVYLPPFKAAADAGAATFMNSFNSLNGIPASGNKMLQRDILKGKWNFKGFVVSDWGSIGEMIAHGYSKDNYQAAMQAVTAGSDMDMESRSYKNHLAQLVKDKKVPIAVVDAAVRRILRKKFEMGLFDDPYRFCNEAREQTEMNNPAHKEAARDVAKRSVVLLKNELLSSSGKSNSSEPLPSGGAGVGLLPLSKDAKNIALIGPFIKAVRDNLGFWSYTWPDDSSTIVTQYDGIKKRVSANTNLLYAKGCNVNDTVTTGFADAISVAMQAGIVVMSVGEASDMSGEAKSRSTIQLPGVQEKLIKAIYATGKPMVVMINAGRPLVFNWTVDNVPAILYTWWLGTEAGNAIADVLFGDYNPSAKLPMSFPRTEGQIPIYYNYLKTGRPAKNDSDLNYVSAYTDLPNSPKFAFGYGLSYTTFLYGDVKLNKNTMTKNSVINASINVTNTGKREGIETVQLYLRDMIGSLVRPVQELKGFQQVSLRPGETKNIRFVIDEKMLRFYNEQLNYISEPGDFKVMIGGSSNAVKEADFSLTYIPSP